MHLRRCAIALLAITVTGCGGAGAEGPPRPEGTAACADIEFPTLQGGLHLIGDREPPVPYSSTPPTSGWHTRGNAEIGVHGPGDTLTEPEQVGILELGGVVVTHGTLPESSRTELAAFVREHYQDRVALTAYDKLADGAVAFTAWGVLQRCSSPDLDALAAFADAYAEPEPPEHATGSPGS